VSYLVLCVYRQSESFDSRKEHAIQFQVLVALDLDPRQDLAIAPVALFLL